MAGTPPAGHSVVVRALWFVCVMAAVAAGGCSDDEKAVPISGDVLEITGTEFEATLGCYEHVRIEVDEGQESVELRGFGEGEIGGDCGRTATVSLDAPLGERDLVDGKTGRVIEVTPAGG